LYRAMSACVGLPEGIPGGLGMFDMIGDSSFE